MASSTSQKLTKYETRGSVPSEFLTEIFPDEIVENILERLPVKCLSRFKCVSKPWLSLISSPRFIKTHLNMAGSSNNLPRILLTLHYSNRYGFRSCSVHSLLNSEEAIDIDYPKTDERRHVFVLGSCNGLVCLYILRTPRKPCDYYIWNPCTGISKKLPPVKYERGASREFRYDAVADDYMVMSILIRSGELKLQVYSMRADSWKTKIFTNFGIQSSQHLFFDGKMHTGPSLPMLTDILSFDLETDAHGTIERPDYGDGDFDVVLKELVGCFGSVCSKTTHTDFWVMKEYGVKESWTKMLTVSFLNVCKRFVYMNPLIVLPSGEILVAFYARLEVHNLKDNSIRVLDTSKCGPFVTANLYIESLVSPTQHERTE